MSHVETKYLALDRDAPNGGALDHDESEHDALDQENRERCAIVQQDEECSALAVSCAIRREMTREWNPRLTDRPIDLTMHLRGGD